MRRVSLLVLAIAALAACGSSAEPADQSAAQVTGGPASRAGSYTSVIPASGDPVDVHYPTHSGRFPVVVVLQGANVDKAQYATFASELAQQGFVVLVPNHKNALLSGLFTSEEVVTQALAFAIAEGLRLDSPIAYEVDGNSLAIVGHSFGGVAGLLAVQGSCAPPFCTPGAYTRPAALKAAAFWGTNMVEAGVVLPVDTSAAPVALVQGTLDGLAHPADGLTTFGELARPKAYVTVAGANHYGIADTNEPAGASADPNTQTLPQSKTIGDIVLFAGLFLRAHVQGDHAAAWFLDHAGSSFPGVTVQTVN